MRASLAGIGATLLAVACCAAAPLLLGVVGGLTLLKLAGAGAALVLGVALVVSLVLLRLGAGPAPASGCDEDLPSWS